MMRYLLIVLLLLFSVSVFAKDLGEFGTTYDIAEPDFLDQVHERVKNYDWDSVIDGAREDIKKNAGVARTDLPPATSDNSFLVDLTYTLDHDIPRYDEYGNHIGVLYEAGYTFNPLEYVQNPETYVFLNGDREEEVAFFKHHYGDDMLVYPILTSGNIFDVSKVLKRKVYIMPDSMHQRFNISKTPSVVYQEGIMLRVDEINVPPYSDDNLSKNIIEECDETKKVCSINSLNSGSINR